MSPFEPFSAPRCFLPTALATAVLSVAAVPAFADPVAIVERWAAQAADTGFLDIAYEAVDHDPADARTTVTGLTVTVRLDEMAEALAAWTGDGSPADGEAPEGEAWDGEASYVVRFPSVSLVGLARQDGHFTARSMAAGTVNVDAVFDIEPDGQSRTESTYRAVSASGLRWAALPDLVADPDRPLSQFLPLLRAATDVSFDRLAIEAVVTHSNVPGEPTPIVQRIADLSMTDAVRGDIGRIAAASFAMTGPDPDGAGSFSIEAGPLQVRDYNGGTMLDVLTGAREATAPVPALGEMRLSGLHIAAPGEADLSIGSVGLREVGVRSPSMALLPYLDGLFVAGRADPDFELQAEPLIGWIAAFYGAFSLGEFEIGEIEIAAPELETARVGAYGVRDLSARGLGSLYLRGLDVAGSDGARFRYDQFEINDIGFPPFEALVAFGKAADAAEGNVVPIDVVLPALPTFGQIVNAGVRVRVPGEVDLALDGSLVEMTDHIGPVPTRLAVTVDRLRIDVDDLEPDPRRMLEGLGYDELVLSTDMLARWRAATSDLAIEASAELADGARLEIDGQIGNVPRLVFERPDQTGAMALLGATFKQMEARLEDASLVKRGIALAAGAQGVTAEAVRAQIMAMVPVALAELGDAELAARAAAAIRALVEEGAPVRLSVVAPAPLPLVAIGMSMQSNPASIIDALQIEIGSP